MADYKQTHSQNLARINISDRHEIRYWTQALGISAEQLLDAVAEAGPLASDVRNFLRS